MNNAKAAAKALPDLITKYTQENFDVFINHIAEKCDVSPDQVSQDILNEVDDEIILSAQQSLINSLATSIIEDCSIAFGDKYAFRKKFNDIMTYIEDPKSAMMFGDIRPTSKIYSVYESVFGRYHDNSTMNIVMLYDICYYILTEKVPKQKKELESLQRFHNAFVFKANEII